MKIPNRQPLKILENTLKCEGVFAVHKKKYGRGYTYYLDSASSPNDKDVVFLVSEDENENYWAVNNEEVWELDGIYVGDESKSVGAIDICDDKYMFIFPSYHSDGVKGYLYGQPIEKNRTMQRVLFYGILKCVEDWCNENS